MKRCPVCGELQEDRGLVGHIRFAHGVSPADATEMAKGIDSEPGPKDSLEWAREQMANATLLEWLEANPEGIDPARAALAMGELRRRLGRE